MVEVLIILGIMAIGVSYYFIFKEHHKRNEMTFSEIYPLIIEYVAVFVISIVLIVIGVRAIIEGCINNDEISEVIKEFAFGIVVISLTLLHFIFWIKKHKVDLVTQEREESEERTSNIAEWIELIAFILIIIGSIVNIFKYAQFIDEVEKYSQIGSSIFYIIVSTFLLYKMNPLGIFKHKK